MRLDLPTSIFDRPATDAELASFYGTPLSASAIELAQEKVCQDVDLFADFIAGDMGEREHSALGAISVTGLVREILLNPKATDAQLAAAARELRTRYLADKEELVLELAAKEMNA